MELKLILVGLGGQGVVFLTRLLSKTALALGQPVMVSETHGMSQRGGSVISHLKIGGDEAPLIHRGAADALLALEADEAIRTFQADAAREAGIFHHLITLPTYHTAALSTDNLAKEYFGDQGMLGYVKGVQRKEIRQGIACVKHQNMAGSDMGDDHKEYFAGEAALKASGKDNTMNQFG